MLSTRRDTSTISQGKEYKHETTRVSDRCDSWYGPEDTGKPEPEYSPYGVYYGSSGGFKGRKRYLYNGGVCVPAFAVWPGVIESGRTVTDPVCTLDYLPTLSAILG